MNEMMMMKWIEPKLKIEMDLAPGGMNAKGTWMVCLSVAWLCRAVLRATCYVRPLSLSLCARPPRWPCFECSLSLWRTSTTSWRQWGKGHTETCTGPLMWLLGRRLRSKSLISNTRKMTLMRCEKKFRSCRSYARHIWRSCTNPLPKCNRLHRHHNRKRHCHKRREVGQIRPRVEIFSLWFCVLSWQFSQKITLTQSSPPIPQNYWVHKEVRCVQQHGLLHP